MRAFVVSGLIPRRTKKFRNRCTAPMRRQLSISPSEVHADERSGLFPENESSLFENHAPVRCRRVNPATGAKEF
jgi:hypothetical protein